MKSRLTPFLCTCLLGCLNLNAQTSNSIHVELQNVSMAEALKNIENKTGSHILFDYKDVEQFKVSCNLNNTTFEEAIETILSGTPLEYKKVRSNTYIITRSKGTEYVLSGLVKDSLHLPVEAAVVSVINAETGTSYSQCITDTKGQFSIKAKGNIQLYVNCLGYSPYLTAPFIIKNDTVLNVALQSSSIMLDNVLVVGEKQTPSVRVINGNTVFFPKNSATLAGGSALDVLKKTPGIFVDGNDNVSIGGRNGVLIIFNGKPTYMQQEELVSMLKSMSSTAVSSIEIINNPSAQYDAEGSGGIINPFCATS